MNKSIKKFTSIVTVIMFALSAFVICGSAETRPAGDVDANGVFDEGDSVRLSRWLAGWDVTIDKAYADVTTDGCVTENDAVLISRKLAGWDVTMGIGEPEIEFPTIDEVMEYLDIPSKPGVALSYYTAVVLNEGSDYTIYTYTDLTESVKRTVYEFIGSEEAFEEFKSLHFVEAKQNGWQYIDECPGLVRIDYSDGFMFNPNTEYPQAEANPDNTLYYGKSE